MEKNIIMFSVMLLIICFFSCTTSKVIDNTFLSEIENKSDFTITIDNENVLSGEKIQHKFPLHENALYDGWSIDFEIPFTENVSYILKHKISIVNNQKKVEIENPKSIIISECYVIIHNHSNEPIKIKNKKNGHFCECYTKGIINGKNHFTYDIAPNSDVVCEVKQSELYACDDKNSTKANLIKLNTPYKKGYVYTVSIEDDKATLVDCRPLTNLGEKSWQKEYKEEEIRAILQKNENIYLLGFKPDEKSKDFKAGFLRCLDMYGEQKGCISFGRDIDTYLYAMAFSSNNSIIIAGRSTGDKGIGWILEYDLNEKNPTKKIPEQKADGFDRIMPVSDGSFILWNHNNTNLYFNFNQNGSCNRITPRRAELKNSQRIAQFITSEEKYIEDKQGNIYIAGETSDNPRRPKATVVKLSKDNKVEPIYTAEKDAPCSWVSDIILNDEETQLIMVGYLNAKNSCGQGGTPFIRCLDLQTKEILWETLYKDSGYDFCMRIAKCENYGYILLFANVDDDGNTTSPYQIIRTNATGKQM